MQDLWSEIVTLGIDERTIMLILFLPVVSTIVGIARHIVGIKTLSIYAPIVLTFAFIELSVVPNSSELLFWQGLRHGIIIFILVFLSATGFYSLTRGLRMHYFPKMSLIFTIVSIVMLTAIIIAAFLGRYGFTGINIFSIVLISATSERLVSVFAKTNFRNTLLISIETLILTVISYSVFSIAEFREFLVNSPWVMFILVVINLYIGRYRGLRFREYWRFRSILDQDYTQAEGGKNGNNKGISK